MPEDRQVEPTTGETLHLLDMKAIVIIHCDMVHSIYSL